jgi:putrescine aminotransferase
MLTSSEIAAALAVVRSAHAPLDLLPLRVQLLTPDASALPLGQKFGRRVQMQLWSAARQTAFEAIVSLAGRALVAFRPLPGAPAPMLGDVEAAFEVCRRDPRFVAAMQQRNMQANDLVIVPCAASVGQPARSLFFSKSALQKQSGVVQPVDGLFPVVDLTNKSVRFLDRFEQFEEPTATAPLKVDSKTVQEHAAHALSLIYKHHLTPAEQDQVMDETLKYWKGHVNAGFLKYRKSVADGAGAAALDWLDNYPGTAYFQDHRGQRYIDLLGGFGIYNLGRRHPKVVSAVQAQLGKQALHSQELLDPLRAYCAHLLSLLMPSDDKRKLTHSFFTNSGTESVEACLKMAFVSTGRKTIIAAVNAFHGKTLGALSCTSKAAFRGPFVGAFGNTQHVPFNDVQALRQMFAASRFTGNEIAGLILEPIQGEGGIHVATLEYLKAARALCDEYGAVLIFDEVQSGMCRTGKWWACQHYNVCPDLMAIGKGFGGGVAATGACVGTEQVWQKYIESPFLFTTTFGGNPLALSASIATINVMLEDRMCDAAQQRGDQFMRGLRRLQAAYPTVIKEIRGMGLMIGIEFSDNDTGVDFSRLMFARKVLVSGTLINAQTIRIEPPLTITREQVDYCLDVCDAVAKEILASRQQPIKAKM